jgi:hypothetical protein
MKYQAFISYKHSEISREKAISVEKALKKYGKPVWKPGNIKIFRDEKEMQPGDNLEKKLYLAPKSPKSTQSMVKNFSQYI